MGYNNAENDSDSDSSSSRSSNSRSRSGTPDPEGGNVPNEEKSDGSPASQHSGSSRSSRSRSRSPHGVREVKSPHATERHSRSRSTTRSPKIASGNAESRSQSPNLEIDDRGRSNSRSRSKSHSRSKSRSSSKSSNRSRSRSRSSRSRSKSGTPSDKQGKTSRQSSAHSSPRSGRSSRQSGSDLEKNDAKKRRAVLSDSDGEGSKGGISKLKKSKLIDSDSDDEPTQNMTADALFGDADDISVSGDEAKSDMEENRSIRSRSRSRSKSRSRSRSVSGRSRSRSGSRSANERQDQHQERDDEPEAIPETRIDVEIPRIVTDLGKEIHFIKLPNFLSVDTRPYDQETYEDEIDEEETMDEEGRQRIKLKVSNTIRWREFMNDKGEMVKESNARYVKWSDGSMTLHLGNETFDVYRQPLHGDHNHMFIRQGTGLQGQAVFRTKLTFRPHSTESFTHKKMTMSLADRSQKTSGIKILTQVGKDPNVDRRYNLKKEEEKLRQAMRNQNKTKPKKSSRTGSGMHDSHGANSSYNQEEGSDDENAISLSAIKNKYKQGGKADAKKTSAIYSSDEDEGSDFEGRRNKKMKALKALQDSDSDGSDDKGSQHDGSDDEEEGNNARKSGSDETDSN